LLAAVLCLGAVDRYLDLLNQPPPERVRRLVARPRPLPATPQRLLWVLVDGLRADVAGQLPGWRRLAARGVRLEIDVGTPSFSRPVYAVLGTGAPQAHTGVRTNRHTTRVPLDSLFARLAAQGRRCAVVAEDIDWWARLYDPHLGPGVVVPRDRVLGAALRSFGGVDLLLVHLLAVDHVSHYAGPLSREGLKAARWADDVAERLARRALARGWAVFVSADHGHVGAGGHGGGEPEVRLAPALLLGAGVGTRSGSQPVRAQAVDVAPTLAALLGAAQPAHAEGRVLTEALAGGAGRWEAEVERLQLGQLRLWRAWIEALGAPGERVWALDPALQAATLQAARRRQRRDLRLVVAAFATALLVGLLLLKGRRRAVAGLAIGASYPVLAGGLYWAFVGRFSFSDVPLRATFVRSLALVLAVALVPAACWVVWLVWRSKGSARRKVAGRAALGLVPASLPLVFNAVWVGWPNGTYLAEAPALFLPLVTGPLVAAYAIALGTLMVVLARGRR